MLVDVAQRMQAAPILVALTLAGWACGPVKGSGDGSGSASADGSSTFDATSVSVGSVGEASGSAASVTTASDSSTGAALECPDNVALEPFCYRKFPIAWDGELGAGWRGPPSARVGNFGADGEEAFLLADREGGTPIGLAFWNGNGFDVQPWGVVPELSSAEARIPIRFFDGLHSDLLVGSRGFEPILAVAPWTPDGPGQPIAVGPPPNALIVSVFEQQPIMDADGDGRQEFAVYSQDSVSGGNEHYLVRNVAGAPGFSNAPITHTGACGGNVSGIAAGRFDDDAFVDLAAIGYCDVDDYDGAFAFAAEWGNGTGTFNSVGIPFFASLPAAWLGAADFDGDGLDDVVIAMDDYGGNGETAYIELHRARGDRTFAPPTVIWSDTVAPGGYHPFPGSPPTNSSFILGDVDGDGRSDVVFAYFMSALIGAPDRPVSLSMFAEPWPKERKIASAFDFNHDGRLDFVVQDEASGIYALVSA